jgi:ribosomal protein S14
MVSQEGRSAFGEVTVSGIISKKCICTCALFRTVSKMSYFTVGRAVAQAVSGWLPTAAARVRVRTACEVCGGQSGTGAGFLRVLRFPLWIIPPISPLS